MIEHNPVDDVDWMGASLAIRRYLRWSWVLVVAALLGAAAGTALPSSVGPAASARATLGLTDEVSYPFYDVILARQAAIIEDQDLLAEAEAATGHEAMSLTVDSSNDFSLSQIDVTVEAESPEAAQALVNDLAQRLVEANRVRSADQVSAEVAQLEGAIADQQTNLDGFAAEITALATRVGEINNLMDAGSGNTGALSAEREIARTELGLLGREIDTAEILQSQLGGDLVRAKLELEALEGEVELARRAQLLDVDGGLPLAAILGAVGALVGLAVIPIIDHRFGRIRRSSQVARLFAGTPIVDLTATDGIGGSNSISTARLVLDPDAEQVAVAAPRSEQDAIGVARAMEDLGHLVAIPVHLESPQAAGQIASSDAFVLVVASGARQLQLSRLHTQLRGLGHLPDVVVYGVPGSGASGGI